MRLGLPILIAASLSLSQPAGARGAPLPLIALQDRAPAQLRAGQPIEFDALARYMFGELQLFDSQQGADLELVYPYCISGNAQSLSYPAKEALDRKWVRVRGTLESAHDLKSDRGTDYASSDGLSFRNDCFGAYVLRIERIEEIDPAPYAPRDCVPRTANFCIPAEYDAFWRFQGALARARPFDPNGPVTIGVEAIDNFFNQTVTGMSRKDLGDYVLYFRLECETTTICMVRTAPATRDSADAVERTGTYQRSLSIMAKDEAAMATALGKLRYCPAIDCEGGPSISLAELKAAEGS